MLSAIMLNVVNLSVVVPLSIEAYYPEKNLLGTNALAYFGATQMKNQKDL